MSGLAPAASGEGGRRGVRCVDSSWKLMEGVRYQFTILFVCLLEVAGGLEGEG